MQPKPDDYYTSAEVMTIARPFHTVGTLVIALAPDNEQRAECLRLLAEAQAAAVAALETT